MENNYLKRILRAHVYDVAIESPLPLAPRLSERLGNQIFIKREDLQPIFSFKIRGAYNRIANLTEQERQLGVITASAGNHAQGVALSAKKFGIKALIVMPMITPSIKVQAVKRMGAEVLLHGESYNDAQQKAYDLQKELGMTFVHPYDDPDVIAGQGTVGLEILRQSPVLPDIIFVPVGGGGLISGVAVAVKSLYPDIKIIGVEPVDAASMKSSLDAGKPVVLASVGTFADGVTTKTVGQETFRIAAQYVDEVILVDNDSICAAVKDVCDEFRSILEPAGAISIAGLKAYVEREKISGKNLCAIASGANLNFNRLRHIAERADYGENREAIFAVTLDERPGAFKNFCTALSAFNITEFNYRFDTPKAAFVYVGIEIRNKKQRKEITDLIKSQGLPVVDLSENEVAKLHIRHMVGGKNSAVTNERIIRFQFPERPGALMKFLSSLNPRWNISLFHYRSHSSDVGRVLSGIQVPDQDQAEFNAFLERLGYEYFDETQNEACQLFL